MYSTLFHRRPLGKSLRDVYEFAMKGSVATSQQYKEAWQFLKLVSRFDLKEKTERSLTELRKVRDKKLERLVARLEDSLQKMEDLTEEDTASHVSSPAVR